MEQFWNDFEIKRPPLVSLQVKNAEFAKEINVAIGAYLQQMEKPDATEFAQSAALLSRLMARRSTSFRGMSGFRSVCKLNSALCRLLRVDLTRELEHFRGALPDLYVGKVKVNIPTRHSFEYVLIRLVSVHHIHKRIRACCTEAADYFLKMLRCAFFLDYNTLLIANMAKINHLSVIMDEHLSMLYQQLLPYRAKFPYVEKHNFLPTDAQFPEELLTSGEIQQHTKKTKELLALSDLTKTPNAPKNVQKTDIGSAVKRKESKKSNNFFNVAQLENVEDIKKFIISENLARKNKPTQCTTKAIMKHDWVAAQKLFERKCQTNEQKKAINIFCKFISSKV